MASSIIRSQGSSEFDAARPRGRRHRGEVHGGLDEGRGGSEAGRRRPRVARRRQHRVCSRDGTAALVSPRVNPWRGDASTALTRLVAATATFRAARLTRFAAACWHCLLHR